MEHKTAINIFIKLLDNESLTPEEREAIHTAIGVLSWTKLTHSRVKRMAKMRQVEQDQSDNLRDPSKS